MRTDDEKEKDKKTKSTKKTKSAKVVLEEILDKKNIGRPFDDLVNHINEYNSTTSRIIRRN